MIYINKIVFVMVLILAGNTFLNANDLSNKSILILHHNNSFIPANRIMDSVLGPELINAGIPSANIYCEYLEDRRFINKTIEQQYMGYLTDFYSTKKIDCIIITEESTLFFLEKYGHDFLPDAPIVLCGVTVNTQLPDCMADRITGNYKTLDIKTNIETIIKLHKDIEKIAVLIGTSRQDAFFESFVTSYLETEDPPVEIEIIKDSSLEDSFAKITAMPSNTAVLAISVFKDGAGNHYNPKDIVAKLVEISPVPVYGISDTYLNTGFVGGNLMSFKDLAEDAVTYTIKILNGQPVSELPARVYQNKNYFNYDSLVHHNADICVLPEDTIFFNRTRPVWEAYQTQFVLALAALIFGALIIIFQRLLLYTKQKQSAALNDALDEKKVLLRELYHRTKNNMTVIASLLELHLSKLEDDDSREIIKDMSARIHAMAMVHTKLYQSKSLAHLYLDEFINDITELMKSSYSSNQQSIDFKLQLEHMPLLIDDAMSLGIVLNELFLNSVKHAKNPLLEIELIARIDDNSLLEIIYSDSGKGLPEDFSFDKDSNMGFQTLRSIAESQLKGTFEIQKAKGFSCKISFSPESIDKQ